MRPSTLLTVGLASLASCAPLEERAAIKPPGTFEVTNFVFGCTTTCDWSFDVAVVPSAPNHPAVMNPVHCEGSLKRQKYKMCGDISSTQTILAYIDNNDQLKLEYQVEKPKTGAVYSYLGQRRVGAATGNYPSPDSFNVKETSATAIL